MDKDLEKLYEYKQSSAAAIRASRSKARERLLNFNDTWFNSVMAICFGLGGALVALGPSYNFTGDNNVVAYWIGTVLIIIDGLFIIFLRKRQIEDDINSTGLLAAEIEYNFAKARTEAGQAIKQKKRLDKKELLALIEKMQKISDTEREEMFRRLKKADFSMDFGVFLFVSGLYATVLGLTRIPEQFLPYYYLFGGILIFVMANEFIKSYLKSRKTTKKQIKIKKKIENLEESAR